MKITSKQLKEKLDLGHVKILDVRTPAEFEEIHIEGSELMPLDRLNAERLKTDGIERVIVCRSGGRASKAQQQLQSSGCKLFEILEGGIGAWDQAGYPVVRGKSAISLERQVRISAGILVLSGVVLGSWLNPAFYGISAFVGAGLIFAGITEWCGMGLLLARAPWNQR
jgi:rhodanese-related sulfurtransferase